MSNREERLLRATFQFRVAKLDVEREVLGEEIVVTREDCRVILRLPKHRTDFLSWVPFEGAPYRALDDFVEPRDPADLVTVHVLQADVFLTSDLMPELATDGDLQQAFRLFETAHKVAESLTAEFVEWVRTTGPQPWLAMSSDRPETVGLSWLVDVATGQPFRIGLPGHGAFARARAALTATSLQETRERLQVGTRPPLPESLLADAEHLVRPERYSPDPVRSVLMAAMACEIRVKSYLEERATEETKTLLAYVLENPREVTLTAVDSLFDSLMKVVSGRSLRDDHRKLFTNLRDLFTTRNRMVHSGYQPSANEARRLVGVARSVFRWLDQGAM